VYGANNAEFADGIAQSLVNRLRDELDSIPDRVTRFFVYQIVEIGSGARQRGGGGRKVTGM
jgi:hypothetical protein